MGGLAAAGRSRRAATTAGRRLQAEESQEGREHIFVKTNPRG
jgi:hypothetical protein